MDGAKNGNWMSSDYNSNCQMAQEELQLQISLNIGSQRYQIKVPKKTDLSLPVQKFLRQHSLNMKYEHSIIRLVRDKLKQEQKKAEKAVSQEQTGVVDTKISNYESEVIKARRVGHQESVNNAKNSLLSKIQQQIQSKNKELNKQNPPESRKVYEKWKQKQKEKKIKQIKPDKASYQTSRMTTQREKHSPDYFYRKGVQFQNEIQQNWEKSFKKLYPFKIQDHTLTTDDQQRLYSRLSKQKPNIQVKLFLQKYGNQQSMQKQHSKRDPIKHYVKQQDQKIDREIFKLIKDRSLTPVRDNRSISKSPFRKTMIK